MTEERDSNKKENLENKKSTEIEVDNDNKTAKDENASESKETNELQIKESVNGHNSTQETNNDLEEKESSEDNSININDIDLERLEKLSDDEAIIELDKMTGENDEIIERDYLSSLIGQDDRLVYYEVENIYHDDKSRAFKSRLKMRKNPPVLVLRDDFGNEAKFYLTENLTDELSETLRQVKRAYYGFSGPSDFKMPEKFIDKVKYYIKNNPFKILTAIFLILFILSLTL